MNVKLTLVLLWLPCAAVSQGFAGLGESAEGFAIPQRGYSFSFPQDHGPHERFRIEWWYVTANLTDDAGRDFGVQWTLFRNALAPQGALQWDLSQVFMGHAALTTPESHFAVERFARGGTGQAGAASDKIEAWIDDWTLSDQKITARGADFGFDLMVQEVGPFVFHGESGYSVKSSLGQASHYYSAPFIDVVGTVQLPEGEVAVTGQAWMDREWSSQPLSEDQTGWDWFSLSFESGEKMMGFRLRGSEDFTQATWIAADGEAEPFGDGSLVAMPITYSPTSGPAVPTKWRVTLPEKSLDVTVEAINPDAWLPLSVPYWEGPVKVVGSHRGRGYLEMTGY